MLMLVSRSSVLLRRSVCFAVLSHQFSSSLSFLSTPSLVFSAAYRLRQARTLPSIFFGLQGRNARSLFSVAPKEESLTQVLPVDGVAATMPKPEAYPTFASVPHLHPNLKSALAEMGLVTMTEIQAKTWQAASSGQDVLGRARTGTGKTVSFLLPALQRLLLESEQGTTSQQVYQKDFVSILVLSPTRELAIQIAEQARQLLQHTKSPNQSNRSNKNRKPDPHGKRSYTHQVIVGGTSKPKDVSAFERAIPTILIATPGRLCDHLQTTQVRGRPFADILGQTKILVLDETDRLLDMGFKREIDLILKYLGAPQDRQTLLFSATIPPDVRAVMAQTMKPSFVSIDCIHDHDASSHTNAQVEQTYAIMPSQTRLVTGTIEILINIMEQERDDLKMVVFFPTANLVAFYARLFQNALKIPVLEIHSRKSQSARTKTADTFREEDNAVLFTSDVSARGVDYPGVTHVVQFGMADSRESYIHRLGRTGRAGKVGQGLLVLTDLEKNFLKSLSGLSIPVNEKMQTLLDGPPSPEIKKRVDPILASIGDDRDKELALSARMAYQSMLGFYNGKLGKLGAGGTDTLVSFGNGFAAQAGLREVPPLELKTVRKMGLSQAKGLNVVKSINKGNNHSAAAARVRNKSTQNERQSQGRGSDRRPAASGDSNTKPSPKRRNTNAGRGTSLNRKKVKPESSRT